MSCGEVARRLPAILDEGASASEEVVAHVESCLVCRSELARYRKLLRLLAQLRVEQPSAPEGLIEGVLASISVAAERQVIRSALSHRRITYALGLALSGAVAGGIVVIARAHRSVNGTTAGAEGASAQ